MSSDDVKKLSRCGNAGEIGHWHHECAKPPRSKAEWEKAEGAKGSYFAVDDHADVFGFDGLGRAGDA